MKKHYLIKRIKNFINKYINGARGAISLLLVLTMSPFMSVSLVLVESARYQDAIESIQEIIDISSFSTLANYDSYLDERFGLLAVSQDLGVNDCFNQYLEKNVSALGKSVTINSASTGADGAFSLADTDVLKEQILEYSELMVSAEIFTEIIDLEDLMDKLHEKFDKSKLDKTLEEIDAGAELTQEIADLVEAVDKITDENSEYGPSITNYKKSSNDFEVKVLNLASALKAAEEEAEKAIKEAEKATKEAENAAKETRKAEEAAKDAVEVATEAEKALEKAEKALEKAEKATKEADKAAQEAKSSEEEIRARYSNIYDNENVKDAINEVNDVRDKLKEDIETLIDELSSMKDNVETVMLSVENIEEKLKKFSEKSKKNGGAVNITEETVDWLEEIAKKSIEIINNNISVDYKNEALSEISALKDKKEKLTNFNEYEVTSDWKKSDVNSHYGVIIVNAINIDTNTQFVYLMTELNAYAVIEESATGQMKDMIDLAKNLTKLSFLHDTSLDSEISSAYLYSKVDSSISAITLNESLNLIYTACDDFINGIKSVNLIKLLKSLAELLAGTVLFIGFVLFWASELLVNLGNVLYMLITEPQEVYNDLLLYGYGAYNNPNRTTFEKGKGLSGYKYKKIFEAAGGKYSKSLEGELLDYVVGVDNDKEGSNTMFKGAVGEYLLVGMNSEISNQSITFYNLYLFRLLLNLGKILADSDVNMMVPGPGGWVVKVAIIIAEPLIDVILLVNGGEQYLIKDYIYLTPKGSIYLARDFTKVAFEDSSIKKDIEKALKTEIKSQEKSTGESSGLFNTDYTEHLLLLLLLTTEQGDFLERMRNVIQMESAENYKGDHTFNLDKTYTYIETDVNYTLNPMFKLDGFNDTSIFKANLNHYMGY